ncbi:MAG: hypothetical protein EXR50_04500 [Dehalococcoidia bacterium]|nr:hypothetical protein [Dehalococcoidia bacterium]
MDLLRPCDFAMILVFQSSATASLVCGVVSIIGLTKVGCISDPPTAGGRDFVQRFSTPFQDALALAADTRISDIPLEGDPSIRPPTGGRKDNEGPDGHAF